MKMNEILDDFEVQRLLDGRLSDEDRVLLLQCAEDNPANCRRIALAFVEEQILREQLGSLQDLDLPVATARPHGNQNGHSQTESHAKWIRFFAQAAVVCLLVGAAVWAGRMSVTESNFGQRNTVATEVNTPGDYTIVLTPEMRRAPEMRRGRNGFPQVANVSMHDNKQDAFERMLTPMFDQEAHLIFRNHGYTVNEEPVIYIVQGQQGEQYVVPRRNVSFVAHHD